MNFFKTPIARIANVANNIGKTLLRALTQSGAPVYAAARAIATLPDPSDDHILHLRLNLAQLAQASHGAREALIMPIIVNSVTSTASPGEIEDHANFFERWQKQRQPEKSPARLSLYRPPHKRAA